MTIESSYTVLNTICQRVPLHWWFFGVPNENVTFVFVTKKLLNTCSTPPAQQQADGLSALLHVESPMSCVSHLGALCVNNQLIDAVLFSSWTLVDRKGNNC